LAVAGGSAATGLRRSRGNAVLRRDARIELAIGVAVVSATTILPLATGSFYWGQVFLLANVYLIAAVSLNILRGEAGQISFGQGAIFGASAYATGMAAGLYDVHIAPAMAIGVLAALAFGLLLALPALRVQGYYLAFVTVAAAVVFPDLLRAYDEHTHAITGISVFVPRVGEIIFWGMDWVALAILISAVAALVAHALIRSSRFGRRMRVAAASPEAAQSLGINPGYMRVAAFLISALGTGLAGALYVALFGFVSPGAFPLALSILIYFSVVVGGESTIIGPIAGLYLLYVLPNNVLTEFVEYRLLVYGLIALGIMLLFPAGLIGTIRELLNRILDRPAGAVISVEELVDERDLRPQSDADAEDAPVLRLRDATKSFGAVRALDGMSLDVRLGEIHALVGPNGSGKTTLLNALSGFVRLESGDVEIDGTRATRWSPRRRARQGVGRTFQTPRVFDDLTVWENVDVTHAGADRPETLSRAALEEAGPRWERVRAATLAHGQRRLLELVRVLRSQPRVVLLDEPAAGLSPKARTEFAETIRLLARRSNVGVVLVEHDLRLVWEVADRITVMENGRLVSSGTPDELDTRRLEEVFMLSGRDAAAG
jgi:branched-chain amino acid transport system permease protein